MDTEAAKIQKRLDQLEAERLILTIELRNGLLRAANELLPTAIARVKARSASQPAPAAPHSSA